MSTVDNGRRRARSGPTPVVGDGDVTVSRLAWFTLAIASLAGFMVAMEVTVISLALPEIQDAFSEASFSALSWVFNAYSLGVASLLLVAGWAADLYGRKRLFLLGMAIFAVGSLGSGMAPSIGGLIVARFVQSVGGAMLFPSGLALILAIFPPARRQLAIGIWAATGGLAAALGPSLGALLVEAFGWRAVFLINVPIAAFALVVGPRVLVESRATGVSRHVDVIGVPLASLGVGALVGAIIQGDEWGWTSPGVLGLVVVGLVLIGLFVHRSMHHPAPLFDLHLLTVRSYRVGLIGSLLFSAGFFGSWVLLPSFFQRWWGWSVLHTGLALMPSALISAVLSGPIGSLVDRVGHRRVVAAGGLLAALGWAGFALLIDTEPNLWVLVLPNLFLGLGMAVLFGMLVGAAMRDVPGTRFGMAGAGRTTTFQLSQAIGIAVAVAVVGRPLTASAALSSYRTVWLLSAALLAGIAVVFLLLYPEERPDAS